FDMRHSLRSVEDGSLATVYEGLCLRCGLPRQFIFTLDPVTPPPPPAFGGPAPSQIICPGQFALLAEQCARSAQLDPARLTDAQRLDGRNALARALSAQHEVIKFIPADADAVPAEAFTSAEGLALYRIEPARFRRDRLAAVADAYRELLSAYDNAALSH